ncbi:TlpA family protein disulfide reductase [Sinomicrobium sp.]
MKKTVYTLLGLMLVLTSCEKSAPVDYALISGQLKNGKGELKIMSDDRNFSQTLELREDGSFSDTLREKYGVFFFINGENVTKIYLDSGDQLVVNADASDFKNTLNFSGEGSAASTYLGLKEKIEAKMTGDFKQLYLKEETEFKKHHKETEQALLKTIDSIPGLDADFIEKEKRNLHYDYLTALSIYEGYHAYFDSVPDFKVSAGFLNELNGLDYNRVDDYDYSSSYRSLLQIHYREQSEKLQESDSLSGEIAYMKVLATIPNDTIRNGLLFDHANGNITFVEDLEAYYTAFKSASTDEKNNAIIAKSYNELKALSKGNPSPVFTDYENYAGGTTSLSDLKGKYVYIDVWATWCGPCKAEIPFLKEVEADYHDKNIEFVSISIDRQKDHEKWKTMVEEEQLKGVQLFADNDWNSKFVTDYLIKGIPKFILIDPEGNIVTSNAPRPSDPKLRELFEEVLRS